MAKLAKMKSRMNAVWPYVSDSVITICATRIRTGTPDGERWSRVYTRDFVDTKMMRGTFELPVRGALINEH